MDFIPYFDLCVPQKLFNTRENTISTLSFLRKYGYRTIAINQEVRESTEDKNENKKKNKKGEAKVTSDVVPEPIILDESVIKDFPDIRILKRLTVIFSTRDFYYKVSKSNNFMKYSILAVLPTTQIAFMFTTTTIEADILTYAPEDKSPFKIERNVHIHLAKKGFYFELLYGPMIEDSTKRKNTIQMAHMYHIYGKSRNIILSSGATNLMYLRNHLDIINLGIILGLNRQQAKDAIKHHGFELCHKAAGRLRKKSLFMVETIEVEEEKEKNDEITIIEIDDTIDETGGIVEEPEPKRKKIESVH